MQPSELQRTLCIISPRRDVYSQTFVRAHRERLPANIKSLYIPDYESFSSDDGPLLKPILAARLKRAIVRKMTKLDRSDLERRAAQQFLARNKVDAVLGEFGSASTLILDACKGIQVPLIAHFHGHDVFRRTELENFAPRFPELFRYASAIIAVSRDMQGELIKLGAPETKLHLNPCGVDPSLFYGSDPLNSPPTFVAVGRFVNVKAPHLTLLAFREVLAEVPETRLVMIGDGPLWDACYQMVRSFGISGSVELQGIRSPSEVAAVMQKARAFVQHCVTANDGESEGTPVAILEAGASGLPVVSTRHAGIKEAVIEMKTGLLVDEGDIDGMAQHMIRLAKDSALAASLGKAAREWISAEYSMDKSIGKLWSIIESVIDQKRNSNHSKE